MLSKPKIIIYVSALVVLAVLAYFAYFHEYSTPTPQLQNPVPTTNQSVNQTKETGNKDKLQTSIPIRDEEKGAYTEGSSVLDNPTVKLNTEIFSYTDEEIAQMSTKRDPFMIQPEIIRLAEQIQKEYDKYLEELEEEKGTPVNKVEEPETKEPIETPKVEETPKLGVLTKEEVEPLVISASERYNISPSWIYAIIDQTSSFDTNKVYEEYDTNGEVLTTSRGLMQIEGKTAPWLANKLGIVYEVGMEFEPQTNVELGVSYLAILKNIKDDEDFVFTAYGKGPNKALEILRLTDTYETDYSRAIKSKMKKYQVN